MASRRVRPRCQHRDTHSPGHSPPHHLPPTPPGASLSSQDRGSPRGRPRLLARPNRPNPRSDSLCRLLEDAVSPSAPPPGAGPLRITSHHRDPSRAGPHASCSSVAPSGQSAPVPEQPPRSSPSAMPSLQRKEELPEAPRERQLVGPRRNRPHDSNRYTSPRRSKHLWPARGNSNACYAGRPLVAASLCVPPRWTRPT